MKTTLPVQIKSGQEAQKFLRELFVNGESFNADDDAHQINFNTPADTHPTPAERTRLNELMGQCNEYLQDIHHTQTMVEHEGEVYFVKDLSGRDGHYETGWQDLWDDATEDEDQELFEYLTYNEVGQEIDLFGKNITRTK